MSRKLTSKQVKAVYLLAGGASATEVAKVLKLRRETLSRWKKLPVFVEETERVAADLREGMKHRLDSLVDHSITTLKSELARYQSDPKRVQTALNVLKLLADVPKPRKIERISDEKG